MATMLKWEQQVSSTVAIVSKLASMINRKNGVAMVLVGLQTDATVKPVCLSMFKRETCLQVFWSTDLADPAGLRSRRTSFTVVP